MKGPACLCPSFRQRVPAGALALVLVISIVISAILLGLVAFYAISHRQLQAQNRQLLVQRNARSGLAYLLASPDLSYFQPLDIDLFGAGTDSVRIGRRPWGMFDIATVIAHQGLVRDTLTALLGSRFSSFSQGALYLPNSEPYSLGLAGTSQLIGAAYLPTQGSRAVYLPGHQSNTPSPLVTGTTHVSNPQLPLDADSALTGLRDFVTLSLGSWLPGTTVMVRRLPAGNNPFGKSPLVWQQQKSGPLGTLRVSGQVILTSLYPIVLDSLSQLDGVMVIAPKITVAKGFRGRAQLFARDTIDVQARAQLAYPSALGVYSTGGTPAILLGEQTFVAGVIVAGAPAANTTASPLIRMHATAQVQGQVYTTGTLLNCGQVEGAVMCQHIAYQFSPRDTRYDNYLVDAVIDRNRLSKAFLTSPWLNPGAPREVLQWLPSH